MAVLAPSERNLPPEELRSVVRWHRLHIEVSQVEYLELKGGATWELASVIRARVEGARAVEKECYAGHEGKIITRTNSTLPSKLFQQYCHSDKEGSAMLEQAMNEMLLSARAHDRILKVALTRALLSSAETIQSNHVIEAIQFRSLERRMQW